VSKRIQRRDATWTRWQRWRREREIIGALTRRGLGVTLAKAGLAWLLPFQWGLLGHQRRRNLYSGPEHLRMAFEDLGPTFIKLAQILSTRGDLIGVDYAAELAKLQSTVSPLEFDDLAAVLDEELGVPHLEVFATIDTTAMGSGSIGQVHRATLPSGETVVKIQRPGVQSTNEYVGGHRCGSVEGCECCQVEVWRSEAGGHVAGKDASTRRGVDDRGCESRRAHPVTGIDPTSTAIEALSV